ncbi:MAG: TOBE domain-containing protein, partial [Nisaea sp.]
EHFQLCGAGEGVEVRVDLVEHLGAETLMHGTAPGNGDLTTVRLAGHQTLSGGDSIRVRVAPEQVHLFDTGSGKRL